VLLDARYGMGLTNFFKGKPLTTARPTTTRPTCKTGCLPLRWATPFRWEASNPAARSGVWGRHNYWAQVLSTHPHMKRTLLLAAALFAFGAAAQAQVSIIPKAGIASSTIWFKETANFVSDAETVGRVTGITSGVGFNVRLAKDGAFSVQPELLYVQKGYRVNFSNAAGSLDSRVQSNYLEVPVLARFTLGMERFNLCINAGPSFAYGLNGQYEIVSGAGAFSSTHAGKNIFGKRPDTYMGTATYYDPKSYSRVDVGLQFGGGAGSPPAPAPCLSKPGTALGSATSTKAISQTTISPFPTATPTSRTACLPWRWATPSRWAAGNFPSRVTMPVRCALRTRLGRAYLAQSPQVHRRPF
jgi:hypothetical protein